MKILKQTLSLLLISQFVLPWAAMAKGKEKDKEHYKAKDCGQFLVISDAKTTAEIKVCRMDNGVLDDGYKTPGGNTEITAPESMITGARNSSKIIDEILLQELRKRAQAKLAGFQTILDMPDSKETLPLKEQVLAFKDFVLDSKKSAIHQIRTILTVYDGMEDELIADHPEYKTLLCKYEVWKHKKEILEKITKISGKIVKYLLIAGAAATVVSFFGLFSIAMMGPIMMALGATEVGVGGLQIFSAAQNWDDVKAGTMAKKLLKFDDELRAYVKLLQDSPDKNEPMIIELLKLELSAKERRELQAVKKLKKDRIKELIGGGVKVLLGVVTYIGAAALNKHFSDFKTNDPATITNDTGGGTLPGSGGNDGDGGFPTDDGG